MSACTLVNVSSYWQWTWFHVTSYTALKHVICWVKMNPNTADRIYEHIYVRFLSSYHDLTHAQRMLTADCSQEQTCSD